MYEVKNDIAHQLLGTCREKMAETEELGLSSEDQLEALDSLENGQEVEAVEGGEGDASVIGSSAVDDPVSKQQ